jgi:hypothetical protein
VSDKTDDLLARRYGAKPVNALKFRIFAILAIIATAAGAVWLGLANWSPIQATTSSFDVESPWQTKVEFELQMPPGEVALCRFEALNNAFFVVGYVEHSFGPFEQLITNHAISINTFEEAVTGLVDRCSLR